MLFDNDKKIVYSTIDGLKLNKDYEVQSYKNLGYSFSSWIERNTIELMKKSTFAEKKFSSILKDQKFEVYEQAFFRIEEKSYFLDFFIPELNLAFEINGSVHKKNFDGDFVRDVAFEKIGIKTIRLTNREVYLPNIKELVNGYVRQALKGVFDATDYYYTPIANKFDDKMTSNQKFILAAIEGMEKAKKGSKILIKTTMSYLISILNHIPADKLEKYDNSEMLRKFYDVVSDKGITYDVVFCGNRANLKGKLKGFVEELDKTPLANDNDAVLMLDGESIVKYKNKKYSEVLKSL